MTKPQDIELIANSIRARRSIPFMKGLFRTVNQLYRECIDRAQAQCDDSGTDHSDDETQARQCVPTVSLAQLKEALSEGESVITDIDMVESVLEILQSEVNENATHTTTNIDEKYLLAVSMAYANSLLSFLIFPHRRLQAFIFSLAAEIEDFPTVQHLLNYHVVMDSPETLELLGSLHSRYSSTQPWMVLAYMDMAKRMGRTEIVIECLLQQNRSLELVEYVRSNDPSFHIEKMFNLISKYPNVNRKHIWEQVEAWNVSPGLNESELPVLSHRVVMLNSH